MIILADIGNTTTVIGFADDTGLLFSDRFPTHGEGDDFLLHAYEELLARNGLNDAAADAAIITSVVPEVTIRLGEILREYYHVTPVIVDHNTDTGVTFMVDQPEKVGTDLYVGISAAIEYYDSENPVVVIDMGTATTFAAADGQHRYLGHVILPGAGISLQALLDRTAQLPPIDLEVPPSVIGKNTKEAMQSGILYGNASMIDGMLDRIFELFPGDAMTVVATGGLAGLIVPLCRHEIILDKDLLLKGLFYIYQRVTGKE